MMRALEPRLFPYIWRYSKGDQLKICAVVLASLPFYFASLDLPKRIVNDAITGKAFTHGEATTPFLELTVQWPDILGGGTTPPVRGLPAGPARAAVRPLDAVPVARPDQRRLQVLDQPAEGHPRRADAAPAALPAVLADAALLAGGAAGGEVLRDGDDHPRRSGADRLLHRRRDRGAGVPRHPGRHRAGLHHDAEPVARPGRRRHGGRPDDRDPAAAARDHPPQPAAPDRLAQPRRPRRRGARRLAGGPAQRHGPLGAGRDRRPALQPLRPAPADLPAQVRGQIPQQPARPGHAVPVLRDRRRTSPSRANSTSASSWPCSPPTATCPRPSRS